MGSLEFWNNFVPRNLAMGAKIVCYKFNGDEGSDIIAYVIFSTTGKRGTQQFSSRNNNLGGTSRGQHRTQQLMKKPRLNECPLC